MKTLHILIVIFSVLIIGAGLYYAIWATQDKDNTKPYVNTTPPAYSPQNP